MASLLNKLGGWKQQSEKPPLRPKAVLLDVNGTLFSPSAAAPAFKELGLDESLVEVSTTGGAVTGTVPRIPDYHPCHASQGNVLTLQSGQCPDTTVCLLVVATHYHTHVLLHPPTALEHLLDIIPTLGMVLQQR
jgi:hypothetical protein